MVNMERAKISDEIKKLIPLIGKEKASKLETAYLLGDEEYRKRIDEVVNGLKATILSDMDLKESVLIEPPARDIAANGDFQLGTILYGKKGLYPLFLNKRDLLTHIGIFGSSGSGKTNIVHYIINSLSEQKVPMLIFDFSKRNYRDLLEMPELKDKIKVYTVGRNVAPFRFNPLKPPEGVQVSQWAKEFAEVFDHAYWLLGGGRHIILKALDELYKKYSPGNPKIFDIKAYLEKYAYEELSAREKNWIATAKRPLESLCMRETGEIFDCDDGIQPSSFFEKDGITVLELDSLSNDDKTFFIEIILQWIRDWLLVSNKREKLIGLIVLEEAHHVLNREKTKKFGIETVTDLIFREIRELGIGMVYVDQHPSLVSYPALGNTSTHLYMNLGLDTKYSSDVQDASNMLGLRNEDDTDYLRRLPIGHSFILIRKSVFPNPFLIKFPLMPIEKGAVTDDLLRENMGKQLLEEVKMKNELASVDPKTFAKIAVERAGVESRARKVNSKGWRIIEVLAEAEAAYSSEIYKELKMSYRVFNEEVKRLVDLGFIAYRKARVYKQTAIYYFLTHDGELAFALNSGKFPEDGGVDVEKLKEDAISCLTLRGWSLVDKRGSCLTFENKGERVVVNVENAGKRGQIYEDIDKFAMDGEIYFICGSERIKHLVAQQSAKYSFDHRGMNLVVFVADVEDLKGGKFKRIEFSASR